MCKFCSGSFLLSSSVEVTDDIIFFGRENNDTIDVATIKKWQEYEDIDVQIDRGHLILWLGEDRGCLDHADDRIKINYCPICGQKLE